MICYPPFALSPSYTYIYNMNIYLISNMRLIQCTEAIAYVCTLRLLTRAPMIYLIYTFLTYGTYHTADHTIQHCTWIVTIVPSFCFINLCCCCRFSLCAHICIRLFCAFDVLLKFLLFNFFLFFLEYFCKCI